MQIQNYNKKKHCLRGGGNMLIICSSPEKLYDHMTIRPSYGCTRRWVG